LRKSPMLTTSLAYLLLGLFFTLERRLRQGQSAQSLETGASDRHSTRLIGGALLVSLLAMLLAPLLNRIQHRRSAIPAAGGWAGLGLMLGGIGLRAWANTPLWAFYTRTLRVSEEQQLIQDGPYQVLRHPGYSGSLLLWIGAGASHDELGHNSHHRDHHRHCVCLPPPVRRGHVGTDLRGGLSRLPAPDMATLSADLLTRHRCSPSFVAVACSIPTWLGNRIDRTAQS
jgi:protein-S-isoprenylcysteine O-methyltransferase Ste14